jgi:hypothetical protein
MMSLTDATWMSPRSCNWYLGVSLVAGMMVMRKWWRRVMKMMWTWRRVPFQ